jgi:hypothetical protein
MLYKNDITSLYYVANQDLLFLLIDSYPCFDDYISRQCYKIVSYQLTLQGKKSANRLT